MAAVAPAQLESRMDHGAYRMETDVVDAEGEENPEMELNLTDVVGEDEDQGDLSDADPDAEGEADDDEADAKGDSDVGTVGAVKMPNGRAEADSDEEAMTEDASSAEDSSVAESDDDSEKSSNEAESVVAEWESSSDEGEDADEKLANRNNCIFCKQDEEHDPSEDFEDYMACAVCGDNCHPQCARDNNSLETDDDVEQWRCPDCVGNALAPDNTEEALSQRRASAPKLTRDLLPAQRGASRPGSHSVFNTLILDDDPLDGSRSLRKRKASSDEVDERVVAPKKRPKRRAESESGSAAPPSKADKDEGEVNSKAATKESTLAALQDPGSSRVNARTRSASTQNSRGTRTGQSRKAENNLVLIMKQNTENFIIAFRLDPTKLMKYLGSQPKRQRRRDRRPPFPGSQHNHFAPQQYATSFYAFNERENDELKSKPYGGILSEADADTSKALPQAPDRARFEDARRKAEEEWKIKTAATEPEADVKARHKLAGPPSKIKCINFGGYEIETWYAAPYPEEYSQRRVLYICEFCLKYMNSDYVAWRHKLKCPAKHPPGDEIYRDKSISVFEVDGRKNPVYCQNLCLLAKLFLGSKTLYYDVEPFLFYVMTEFDELGCHFVGYFSKEKRPSSQNNVSCILTLPIHQRKGYGNLLIDFSYLLTRVERKTGSPEKPLSDMGLVSYRNYWRLVLSYQLRDASRPLSIVDISDLTGMTPDDIISALEGLRALVRDPVTKTYALRLDYAYLKQCVENWEAKRYVKLNPDALVWTPYIMGRSNLAHYDRAPPLSTVAPREGEEEKIAAEEGVQQQQQLNTSFDTRVAAVAEATTNGDGGKVLPINDVKSPHFKPAIHSDSAASQCANSQPNPTLSLSTTAGPPSLTPISLSTSPPAQFTPLLNGISASHPPIIPPTRYEVFPAIPGTTSRRRGGWRGGPRRSRPSINGLETPIRKALGLGKGKGKGKSRSPLRQPRRRTGSSTRRTSSRAESKTGSFRGRRETRGSGSVDLEAEGVVVVGKSEAEGDEEAVVEDGEEDAIEEERGENDNDGGTYYGRDGRKDDAFKGDGGNG